MRIETYLDTNKKEVESKKHNICIGISLGNKYFTKENIKKYIEWAIEYTKEDVLVVIADSIHSINLEVLDKRSKLGALKRAYRKGDERIKEVKEIIEELPKDKKNKVKIAKWNDVIRSKYHEYRLEVILDEFNLNKDFYNYICSIVKNTRKDRSLTQKQIEKLAKYILNEIPCFINGIKYKADGEEWKTYSLLPYPGLNELDKLIVGLQNQKMFPELSKKLKITDKMAILEAYVD